MKNRALFLDRDGVINRDDGYVFEVEKFVFLDGIFELARAAKALGYMCVVVTNQAGIGRGYYSEDDFLRLSDWMKGVFATEGAPIDGVYFCPTHPEHGIGRYKVESEFRKPNPGMILAAQHDFDLDLGASLIVGDKESDIRAGLTAGVGKTLLVCDQDTPRVTTAANAVVRNPRDVIQYLTALGPESGSC
ncbi:HAD family hydrolase [Burkholderia cepacia]|uniref:D-glycero-alpha-D-manno-heptose-1,7-bisphosphate 7-phosphatase n=1 Tax=Burkholderia cepacia TaxID=292 RepID=UPI00075A9768|nr:HAD family hydrolase [Burkholderia cepacia]KVH75307.1 D,D-heptose 1,7-bisphosphate phosphatase [Burkholderia cepacia]KWC65685.1 D,D-heptose 1,7-bisphosphate phosphatase [Burkholderia cepacia]MCA7902359.1 HAD family hydrolase [Burkholderia cepacia]